MRYLRLILTGRIFGELDRSIDKLKDIRNSYRAMNVDIYGEELASLLNDW